MKPLQTAAKRHMLFASEEALWDAATAGVDPERRIAHDIVTNDSMLDVWRPRHERVVESVASTKQSKERRLQLRREATAAQHRRMLIDHIRVNRFDAHDREQLLGQFFPNLDTQTAILREHRRYVLAVSSWISLQRLLGMHDDAVGIDLLKCYGRAYGVYFKLYCQWVQLPRGPYREVVRLAMTEARNDAERLRHRLLNIRKPFRPKQETTHAHVKLG